ncbi:MAG: hypothetical protein EVA67_07400 [OM182 bacterium]|nr:MAG: hypothetical protein EVA67_07400 [OM182 bacterium]
MTTDAIPCGRRRLLWLALIVLSPLAWAAKGEVDSAGKTDFAYRFKAFALADELPSSDLRHGQLGSSALDYASDFRFLVRHDVGNWRVVLDHTVMLQGGDSVFGGGVDNEQLVVSDAGRWVNLTFDLEEGNRHRALHRSDRLNVQWRKDDWAVTLGRQAVSWGSGIVFQPLDPFNPFAPTTVDRDYKAGDDLLLVEKLLANGQDLQLLHVVRRDAQGQVTAAASSSAFKWHGYAGNLEFELIGAQHYDRSFWGLSGRLPLGPGVLRTDIAIREGLPGAGGGRRVLGIVNADVAFPLMNRMAYLFLEYFHNDFGLDDLPAQGAALPEDLREALQRGEVFNLMRDYVALGGSYQWHPLLTHTATVIANLQDGSRLIQTQINYDAAQNQSLQLGWVGLVGDQGDEFAPLVIATDASGPVTVGGGNRLYLRWAIYL